MASSNERKTALTPEERITAAFMHYVRQIDQQDLAMLYGVNMGRVNEACRAIAIAAGMPGVKPVVRISDEVREADNG